jgi:hypothetical protein
MTRSNVFVTLCLAGFALAGCSTGIAYKSENGEAKRYLELRQYHFDSAENRDRFDAFLHRAAIPALNRIGIEPVGVFKMEEEQKGADVNDLFILMPHKTLESVATANTLLLQDAAYLEKGKDVLETPSKKEAVYQRFESSLLLGFDACPGVEVPTQAPGRQFQLRIYESHSTPKAKRKVEMFNKGEIAVFRETGLDPVFFGEALVGVKMPNLTYMVGFASAEAQKAAWDAFRVHPEWKKMSSDPYYKDTVSNITNLVLKPTAASQI